MKNRDEMFTQLVNILVDEFDLDPSIITMDATLYEELDLDSIDTVDLVLRLQDLTGIKIEPETFKSVRSIKDVIDAIEQLVNVHEPSC